MKADAADYTRKCDSCKRLAPILKSPVQDLISISSPWPFAQWGINIVGPLPTAPAQRSNFWWPRTILISGLRLKHSPRLKIRMSLSLSGRTFVCQFGIPKSIVSDNGPQFENRVYRNFCQELKIKNLYSTPRYRQSNGLAEASNKTLLTALKK